ncbi:MAG: hypothetical protein AUJ32_00175 [Parcubacteria group bacterium CG1_02_40_82]|uniref:Uncharacterized protein n=4 Tax=Candidatus Portnoyibacteriota TaxID=1817913 RepID=A0A2M7II79_9BACT|nr:MAG: hypothetical protein AUJ32_00175 [Parcubacteria group bacterium CG1_02_40_82]PIQ75413.1 MAG: hypothetical protein COV84_01395 [Candidatus Portnoybacteria bacterium CG11_big_fil_rev_8_21_14_0_20_40_15]PIS30341.1 MAG: hypothetical protein COT41_03485 [Candidatus Portnoybacteria bacterium CG08_land_8_20_14_0_20_40_83]PIW76205.1 MAG: hypothetical protein CO001_02585 [Candidatus Portnoybacteria bacterium CG_4_8_14_3_um_filter_40_10]PIY74339.1 MAG: hypothetical protein COY85_03530 [Candidatus
MENALKVLQDSVIEYLEGGQKGSKVPQFHEYIEGTNDLKPDKIPRLKEEILQIYKAFVEGMLLTEKTVEIRVPVHETGYSTLLGVPVEKDAREIIASFINTAIDECQLAILANCGFGKYSPTPEKIQEVKQQLRESVEMIYLPLPKGSMELKIVAYDSNNNPKHHFLVDGLWTPFVAIGLVAYSEGDILAFQATMDYGSGNWKLDKFGTELIYELADKSSFFKDAYQKLTGGEFNAKEVKSPNPEFVNFIKCSPHFQQALNRVCRRWVN